MRAGVVKRLERLETVVRIQTQEPKSLQVAFWNPDGPPIPYMTIYWTPGGPTRTVFHQADQQTGEGSR